jgi:type IV secretion system protein TrbL
VLGALAVFMLAIFGPGIAAGLVSGAPQLGAGAAVGSMAGLALGSATGAGLALGGARALGIGAAGATRAAASLAGGAGAAYGLGRAASGASGSAGVTAGLAGMAQAGTGVVGQGLGSVAKRATAGIRTSYQAGGRVAFGASGGTLPAGVEAPAAASAGGAPAWAPRLRREQRLREGVTIAAHTIRDGDRQATGEAPRLREDD